MKELLWAERQKLHRSKMIWITIFATIMIAVIVFAQGQFIFNGSRYVDKAGWFMTAAQFTCYFLCPPCDYCYAGQLYDMPGRTGGHSENITAYSGQRNEIDCRKNACITSI